jgi:hypothetical protein
MKAKIGMVYCYFGKWPKYFSIFLKTCRANPDLDFIFFSNCEIEPRLLAPNIRYIHFTLAQFNDLATQRLGFPVNVCNPYKLCDFKPAYGYIFERYLTAYDFWGFGDIDIVLGNIKKFISDADLQQHDIISVRKEYISGFFSIFRNTTPATRLFMKSKDWQAVFQDTRNHCFDECNYAFDHLWRGNSILTANTKIQSMTEVAILEQRDNNLRVRWTTIVEEGFGYFQWKDGTITNAVSNNEFMLLHLIDQKGHAFFEFPGWKEIPDQFYVNFFGFSRSQSGIRFHWADTVLKLRFLLSIIRQCFKVYFSGHLSVRKIDADALARYEGEFQWGTTFLKISTAQGKLICAGLDETTISFRPVSQGIFVGENFPYLMTFKLDTQGRPTSLNTVMMPYVPIFSFNNIDRRA